jgi:uncharacterized membrane protein
MLTAKKWRCLTCGYSYEGEAQKEKCPVCYAPETELIISERFCLEAAKDIIRSIMPHPILAHFANGLIPVAFLFLLLFIYMGDENFEKTAFYLLALGVGSAPFLLITGIVDWQERFAKRAVPVFPLKITLAIALIMVGIVTLLVRVLGFPKEILTDQPLSLLFYLYTGLTFLCVCLVILLGHLGGKLTFSWKREV